MDTIVHAAIEEICSQGVAGISLSHLWLRLQAPLSSAGLNLCLAVKRAVFSGLSAVPGLQFKAPDGSDFDPKSKPFEECEGLELKVFADEKLRHCFLGFYDVKASHITDLQHRVLERLAVARGNGVTQYQLCKELEMPPNNFFYVVKRLESWGLVVRHSTIVRTKEAAGDKEPKNSQPMHTNLIRLHRYAPSLSSQQRLEITKDGNNLEENNGDSVSGAVAALDECGQDDVLVKDFLPAMKAVCDRLEQAEGKVLVVKDIKKELGYREAAGHRAWRNHCDRLKQAGLVEVFEANVGSEVESPTKSKKSRSRGPKKPESCLKLLKRFSPKILENRTTDCEDDNLASDQHITSGKPFQNTEQLVELPLEQQIVDMIDAEGSKGLLGVEVCKRLGISNKMLDRLSKKIVPQFGLHQVSENCKRGSAYRFWTRENLCAELPNSSFIRLEGGHAEVRLASSPAEKPSQGESSRRATTSADYLNSDNWLTGENTEKRVAVEELKNGSREDGGSNEMVIWADDSDNVGHDISITSPPAANEAQSNSLVKAPSIPVPKPFNLQQGRRYPSLTSATRELRILEKLETEKIIIKPELQRWLESFEKDKQTRMDRKTLQRCLTKLKLEGHCKLMEFNIPGVTNCGRHREILVVLHPSVEGSASELSEQVHDKLRSFEMQIRSALSPHKKEVPVPVLHGIERIQTTSTSDAGNMKAEAMRANGFVLAKMVRTKLLHCFLWDYVNNPARCIDVPTSTKHVNASSNPHRSCLLFSLDTAIKAMPLELFLQVVGSALKWKDMIEKCKNGLLLSDFPDEEYKSLMDTRATSRLSWLIDVLRRLKLIKLVADESPEDAVKSSHATLVYALELKPYIEEPPSGDLLPRCFLTVDLRPHFRHDFVLSTAEALEKYWQTLEYCYAAADPKAAVHAFPGSVVDEVCLYRSWTTIRVMKAEQRAELLKRIKDKQSKKLNFKECREIAKDLNLTLEQVLRVYYDNRQQRLNRFQGDSDVQVMGSDTRNDRPRSQRKRKRCSEGSSAKHPTVNHTTDGEDQNMENPEAVHEQESLVGDHKLMLNKTRQPKLSWTEDAERQLIILYARQRAIQGARRGTDWASINDLPARKSECRKKLAYLNSNMKFRESLVRLCNLLTQRYAQHLDRERKIRLDEYKEEFNCPVNQWDDFEDGKIKASLHEVLRLKQMMKFERTTSASQGPREYIASTHCELENGSEKQQIGSKRRSRRNRLPQKFAKHLKGGVSVTGRVNQSLAASSAVELFKLIFLTNSKSANTPNLLVETLRRYSEHDLISAYDYLRQKKIMIGSGPSLVLSQGYLRSLLMSQFPTNTGKRAARLASWIHEREKELLEGVVNLPPDLQCGDIFQLFALVSSGELSISPVLPDEGVGDAEDSRSSKRKYDEHEYENCGESKKQKCHSLQDSEIFTRREKGFPGLIVSLSRTAILRSNIVESLKDVDQDVLLGEDDRFYNTLGQKSNCIPSSNFHVKGALDFGNITPATIISGDSIWDAMANYTGQSLSNYSDREDIKVDPELIKTAYINIQKAGDQGLSMLKVSECIGIGGATLSERVVNVLESFGLVLKVNGYNFVHVVDRLYRAKYFLTSKATCSRDPERTLSSIPESPDDATIMIKEGKNHEHEVNCLHADDVHKVTILNIFEDRSTAIEAHGNFEGCSQTSTASIGVSKKNIHLDAAPALQPILPWINGDGTINELVYKALTRRVLGVVTQKPGMLEDGILKQMEALNPQSCRKLLDLMLLDKHLFLRKMIQKTSSATPPSLLKALLGNHFKKPSYVKREHYFASPRSVSLL